MPSIVALVMQNLPLPYPDLPYDGKTVIITGSNTGLGLEAARHFTRLRAERVILAVRNLEKGEAAKKSIEGSTGRLGVVECWKMDMNSFAGMKEFIKKAQTLPRLDVLILNAGLSAATWRLSPDGWEETLQVNVLSTALLALQLLPKMVSSAKENPGWTPHLVIVSSGVHSWPSVTSQISEWPLLREQGKFGIFDVLNHQQKSEKTFEARYPVSKLLDIYIAREIAKLSPTSVLDPTKHMVVVNSLDPGLCMSELGRECGWDMYFLQLAFARSTEKGSRVLVDAASKGEQSHSQYLASCEITE